MSVVNLDTELEHLYNKEQYYRNSVHKFQGALEHVQGEINRLLEIKANGPAEGEGLAVAQEPEDPVTEEDLVECPEDTVDKGAEAAAS